MTCDSQTEVRQPRGATRRPRASVRGVATPGGSVVEVPARAGGGQQQRTRAVAGQRRQLLRTARCVGWCDHSSTAAGPVRRTAARRAGGGHPGAEQPAQDARLRPARPTAPPAAGCAAPRRCRPAGPGRGRSPCGRGTAPNTSEITADTRCSTSTRPPVRPCRSPIAASTGRSTESQAPTTPRCAHRVGRRSAAPLGVEPHRRPVRGRGRPAMRGRAEGCGRHRRGHRAGGTAVRRSPARGRRWARVSAVAMFGPTQRAASPEGTPSAVSRCISSSRATSSVGVPAVLARLVPARARGRTAGARCAAW